MLRFVAIKTPIGVFIGKDKERHADVYDRLYEEDFFKKYHMSDCTDGFVDESENFYDRQMAAEYAFKIGQIKDSTISSLYSEDLW